ncbi:MAG: hypothetical protein O2779_04260 [Nanoarchaeota archaeon]|nr:hypothetical protein [Nanoarchaeota archaeon]
MTEVEFYDVKTKDKFKTSEFDVREKTSTNENTGNTTTRFFAVAKSPAGTHECWRVLGKNDAEKYQAEAKKAV